MEETAFYSLKSQKCINSKQKTLNESTSIMFKKYFKDLNGCVYNFSVDYNIIDTVNIINIHKYLRKKHDIK